MRRPEIGDLVDVTLPAVVTAIHPETGMVSVALTVEVAHADLPWSGQYRWRWRDEIPPTPADELQKELQAASFVAPSDTAAQSRPDGAGPLSKRAGAPAAG